VPKPLRDRWQPDSIREFRAAARQRFDDGIALAGQKRRTGAIYMWGYSAEMTLKAAYFSLIGVAETDALSMNDINTAINSGKDTHKIAWAAHGKGHDVRSWAELLVLERAARPGMAFAPEVGREVQRCGQRIGRIWSESLRYHKNFAYEYEVTSVREASAWLLTNSGLL
jgi:hypothetical protein